jgi:TolA-binding protein
VENKLSNKLSFLGLGLLMIALATTTPADAANKEHQQLMADIRMLQEQSQLLQNLIGQVTDAVKTVNARMDQQAETSRKAMADQKLVIDNLTNDARVIREKLDDNNIRIGSLTQEVEALRHSLQQMNTRYSSSTDASTSGGTGQTTAGGATGQPPPVVIGDSPQRIFDAAYADYTAGQYDLAITGFTEFIRAFPRHDLADDAQVYICNAYLNEHKDQQAVDACDLAIRTYPNGNAIPQAYYRKGLALSNLRNPAAAREAWETLVKNFPDSGEASLARQGLDRLRRP